jgi:hypothetical protein
VHVGPLARLPPGVQRLAADALRVLPGPPPEAALRAAALLCLRSDFPVATALRLLEALAAKAAAEAAAAAAAGAPPPDAAGTWALLLTAAAGASRSGVERGAAVYDAWGRHRVAAPAAACAALALAGGPAAAAAALGPPLLELCARGGDAEAEARPLFGLTALALAAVEAGGLDALPDEVAVALPGALLRLVAACARGGLALGADGRPAGEQAAALAARLAVRAPALLPGCLAAAAAASPAGEGAAAAALALLTALAREPALAAAWADEAPAAERAAAALGAAATGAPELGAPLGALRALLSSLLGRDVA